MVELSDEVRAYLAGARDGDGKLVFLAGAGISAESGIPTFRGKEGYWRVGSKNYHPQELATRAASRSPSATAAWTAQPGSLS